MEPRKLTTELIVGIVTVILTSLWPDFPKESLVVLIAWIAARFGQKAVGQAAPTIRAWKTPEFYTALGGAFVSGLHISPESTGAAMITSIAIVIGQVVTNLLKDKDFTKPTNGAVTG